MKNLRSSLVLASGMTFLGFVGLGFVGLGFMGPVAASADSEISNTELSQLSLWVPPGEKLEISNSKLCLSGELKCLLFVDKDAHLEIHNTQLGRGLDIYHADSQVEAIELSNSPSSAKFIEGRPAEFSAADAAGALINAGTKRREREMSNQVLEHFNVTIKAGETLSFSNSKVCLTPSSDECVITLQPGAKLEAHNTDFGSRVVIASSLPLVEGLEFANVHFAGSTRLIGEDAPVHIATTTKMVEENRQVAEALRAEKLDAEVSDRGVVVNLPDVFFEFDKSNLTPEAKANVTKMASILGRVKDRSFSVEGHTDSMGTDSYNNRLSEARANTVRDALVQHGLAGSSLQALGFGESRPVDTNETDLGRARNRRVEVIIENAGIADSRAARTTTHSLTADLNRGSSGNSIVVDDERTEVVNDSGHIKVDDSGVSVHTKGMKIDVDRDGVRIQ